MALAERLSGLAPHDWNERRVLSRRVDHCLAAPGSRCHCKPYILIGEIDLVSVLASDPGCCGQSDL